MLIAHRMSGYLPRRAAILYWNSLMLFVLFIIVGYLLSADTTWASTETL